MLLLYLLNKLVARAALAVEAAAGLRAGSSWLLVSAVLAVSSIAAAARAVVYQ